MLTPEDFTPEKCRIHWTTILVAFGVQLTVLVALSIAVADHSSFETAPSVKVDLSVVADQFGGSLGTDIAASK